MTHPRHIAVIDIGKTNAKLALVDLESLTEVAVVTRPNVVLPGPPWGHFDTEGNWAFLLAALKEFHKEHRVDAISVTTHGASIVLLDEDGQLAAPILDYEHHIPANNARDYDAIRPDFAQTGSPRLANGLNVGAQLHYQFAQDPSLLARTKTVVGYPQYWTHRLTGEVAIDVTSIGCHTDLWCSQSAEFSDLVETLGLAGKMAPVRKSGDILGTILPEIAAKTGLPVDTPVTVGIHDSNASLYPHILAQHAPFSVVSTGTWVITMSVGGAVADLDPTRDTLVNTDALGHPVPSARFMGGREYELISAGQVTVPTAAEVEDVLSHSLMLLPAVVPSTGPFQNQTMRWTGPEPALGSGQRAAALSFYLAMMTATCLSLTGAKGPTIVEGPFAANSVFQRMLGAATMRPVWRSDAKTGTAIGAALLLSQDQAKGRPEMDKCKDLPTAWSAYASKWSALAAADSSPIGL